MHEWLSTRLRVLRAERGLTVRQVAELSGLTKETVNQIETGRRHPYDRTLAKLARAYGVPLEELLAEPVELAVGKDEAPGEAGLSDREARELIVDHVRDWYRDNRQRVLDFEDLSSNKERREVLTNVIANFKALGAVAPTFNYEGDELTSVAKMLREVMLQAALRLLAYYEQAAEPGDSAADVLDLQQERMRLRAAS
jgi:putative transcriptional regulator